MRRYVSVMIAAVILSACGGKGAIFLTIEGVGPDGALKIPDEVDAVRVVVEDVDGASMLLEKDYALSPEQHKFPLTLALEPSRSTPAKIRVNVKASLAQLPVGEATSVVTIIPEEVTSVTVRILRE